MYIHIYIYSYINVYIYISTRMCVFVCVYILRRACTAAAHPCPRRRTTARVRACVRARPADVRTYRPDPTGAATAVRCAPAQAPRAAVRTRTPPACGPHATAPRHSGTRAVSGITDHWSPPSVGFPATRLPIGHATPRSMGVAWAKRPSALSRTDARAHRSACAVRRRTVIP